MSTNHFKERARAAEFGYEDPVNPDYEATTEMYHKCLSECMQRMSELKKIPGKEQRVGIMVASHNADTVRFAIERLVEILIAKIYNDVKLYNFVVLISYIY